MNRGRTSGLEAKDPFLIDYKQNLEELVKGMKRVGGSGIRLLIVEMIRSRWIKDRETTYPYEVGWVFDRHQKGVSKLLTELEGSGETELGATTHRYGPGQRPRQPRTLRKTLPS